MKYKKIVSGILACAMVVTSVFTGNVTTAKAANQPTPLASYDFNGSDVSGDNGTLGTGVEAVVTGLGAYSGDVVYGEGRTAGAGDKAVKLGDYGLKLDHTDLGTDYTVSMWVKPDGTLAANQAVLFLGYHSPEKWLGIAGNTTGTNDVKLWTRDTTTSGTTGYNAWATLTTATCPSTDWTMLTFSQSGSTLSMYVNGELVGTDTKMADVLSGENQSIWIGVNNWDPEFTGLVDDISVYNTALDGAQVRYLYDGSSEDSVFETEGFTATTVLTMLEGGKGTIKLSIPSAVTNYTVEYTSDKPEIATVDDTGLVSGVKAGTATITTKVTVGNVTKTATTEVTVNSSEGLNREVAVEYDLSKAVDGQLVDISGNGNNATLHGTVGTDVEFITEDGKAVMNLKSNNAYLDLPVGIMDVLTEKEQFTIETTFAKSSSCGNNAWLFCFGSIPKATGTNYMFLSPNFSGTTLRAGIKNSSSEKLFATAIQPQVDNYYTVDMVFDKGTVKLYWNGVMIQGTDGNELQTGYSIMDDVVTPGTQNDILGYIGKSCWSADKNYQGKISSFKIYNKAMSDEEIQTSYQSVFQNTLDAGLTEANILGTNKAASEIRYNMSLPASFNEIDVVWESSNPDVISTAGVVKNGAADQEVTLKATITSGLLTASKEFKVTVKALDKTELQTALAEGQKAYSDPNASEDSKAELKKAMDKAANVTTQTEVDSVVKAIRKAIDKLEFSDLYKDPFTAIDESKLVTSKTLAPNATATVFTVPAAIKDMVTVSYSSSNTAVATVNATGVVTGKKVGYTRVTATVKAKYDNFEMEYQTLVKVDLDMTKVTAKAKATALAKGKTTTIAVSYPAAVKNAKPIVTYRATGAVAVNAKGKVTAKSAGSGKVYVTVKAAGKSITKTVTVNVGEITGNSTVKVKKSITLKVTGLSGKVTWSLDKKGKKLATISKKGKLTAKKAGKVKVTAKVGKVTMTKTITIKKK